MGLCVGLCVYVEGGLAGTGSDSHINDIIHDNGCLHGRLDIEKRAEHTQTGCVLEASLTSHVISQV